MWSLQSSISKKSEGWKQGFSEHSEINEKKGNDKAKKIEGAREEIS
jgi:hypothetical protein